MFNNWIICDNMYDNMTQRSHFVSRGYLRFFCNEDGKIEVYDKKTENNFTTTVANICVEKNIYNCIEEHREVSWESFYTEIDKNIPKIINKVKQICEISVIDKPLQVNDIKQELALIMIMQILRTPDRVFSQKQLYDKILNNFEEELRNKNITDKEEKLNVLQKYYSEEYYKGIILREINVPEKLLRYVEVLLDKTWLIYKIDTNEKFITSDNPVVLHNFIKKTVGMSNGIGRSDTIILYPITPQLLIQLIPKQYMFGRLFEIYNNKCILIRENKFINSINRLQYNNAKRQVYGNN